MPSALKHLLGLLILISCLPTRAAAQDEAKQEPEINSALIGRLYLSEAPPELRTLALIWIADELVDGDARVEGRSREEATRVAAELAEKLRAGADWYEASRTQSAFRNRASGGVRGTVSKGLLRADFDAFLFSSKLGAVSDPVVNDQGVFVLKRVETRAGCRMIVIRGTDDAALRQLTEIRQHLAEGRAFGELAKEFSAHPGSRERGGQWAVYERGTRDSHLKLAVFQTPIGEVGGPISSGDSLYFFQRVPVDDIDSNLAENNWIRVRSILLAYDNAPDGLRPHPRNADEAVLLGAKLREEVEAGADMAAIAAEVHDDASGRERFGDMGWIHKSRPNLPSAVSQLWLVKPGEMTQIVDAKIGFGFFRREQ